jgi:hypothetical protein
MGDNHNPVSIHIESPDTEKMLTPTLITIYWKAGYWHVREVYADGSANKQEGKFPTRDAAIRAVREKFKFQDVMNDMNERKLK